MRVPLSKRMNEQTEKKYEKFSQPSAHTYAYSIGWFVCWLAWSNANEHVCWYWCCNYLEVAASRSKIYESSAREKFAENSIIFIDILCFFRLFICSCWQNWAWKLFIWFFFTSRTTFFLWCVLCWRLEKGKSWLKYKNPFGWFACSACTQRRRRGELWEKILAWQRNAVPSYRWNSMDRCLVVWFEVDFSAKMQIVWPLCVRVSAWLMCCCTFA